MVVMKILFAINCCDGNIVCYFRSQIDIIQRLDNPASDTLREKCPNTEFFSGPYFSVSQLNMEI